MVDKSEMHRIQTTCGDYLNAIFLYHVSNGIHTFNPHSVVLGSEPLHNIGKNF
jgi:hypothetical protein